MDTFFDNITQKLSSLVTIQIHFKMPEDNWLRQQFNSADTDRSGQISARELQRALSNYSNWRPFSLETVKMLINMYDEDHSGSINYEEFTKLWGQVIDWSNSFREFDKDNSGTIEKRELRQALTCFGYRFSDRLLKLLYQKYDADDSGDISFDEYIQLCGQLNMMTKSFKRLDYNDDGVIKVTYEKFLELILENKV